MRREALTAETVTDPKRLLAAIAADRKRGYSLVDREAEPHFRSIAVPVQRYDGAIVAAINIGAHVDRVSTEEMVEAFPAAVARGRGEREGKVTLKIVARIAAAVRGRQKSH